MLPTGSSGEELSPPTCNASRKGACCAGGDTGEGVTALPGLGPEALVLLELLPTETWVVGGQSVLMPQVLCWGAGTPGRRVMFTSVTRDHIAEHAGCSAAVVTELYA